MEEAFVDFAEMFEVEPLTAQQQARLPLARELMQTMMPDGAMAEMFDGIMDSFGGALLDDMMPDVDTAFMEVTSYTPEDLDMTEAQAEQVLAIVDPAWRARYEATSELTRTMAADMMTSMEPVIREAMSEVYAVYFTEAQLRDIQAFYNTETGSYFARQSIKMSSDPRIMAAMFNEPELVFGPMMQSMQQMEETVAAFPIARTYAELSDDERARIAELTGLSDEDLQYTLVDWDVVSEEAEPMVEANDKGAK